MLVTCFSTARSVTTSGSAMPWFERPSAMWPSTSRSRGLSADERVLAPPPPDQPGDDLGIERRAALPDATHALDEAVDVGDAVLEQVAEPSALSANSSSA